MERGTPEHIAWLRRVDPAWAARQDESKAAPAPVATPAPAPTDPSQRPVTFGLLKRFAVNIAQAVREEVSAPTSARIAALEARINALEARPVMRYLGTWNADTQCNAGDFITHDGSIWYCRESTRDRPGTSDAFQLAVKRGRDGKDLR